MRILYCNKYNYPFSGTEVYLFELMELMRAQGHEVALFSMADPRGEPTPYDRHFVPHIDFKTKARVVAEGAAGGPCDLFHGRAAADAGHDRGVPAGRGPCAKYLSPFVAVDLVGTEGAERSRPVSPERFQIAVSELQPGFAGGSVRGLQGRRVSGTW